MKKNEFSKSAVILVVLFAIFSALMIGVNGFTAPIIESNSAAQEYAPLLSVMPEAQNFEPLYLAADSTSSTLVDVPDTVQGIYRETSGLGYVLRMSTTKGYTGDPIELTMAVDAEGKISGIELNAYPETKDFGADYPGTYLGQDSTLADVSLVAGCTYSSVAFKNAVADAFAVLVANNLSAEGVKDASQILMELLPTVYSGIANKSGVLQYEEVAFQGTYAQTSMKALNGSGFAYIMQDGSNAALVICNAKGNCRVFDAEGNDVTDDGTYAAMKDEAMAHTAANIVSNTDADMKRFQAMMADATEIVPVTLENVFSTVSEAFRITVGEEIYFGISARSYGYSNMPMTVYIVVDSTGAIVSMTADELILFKEYFDAYTLDEPSYKAGFQGLTADTWTGEQALISGATMSSDAVATATTDIFEVIPTVLANGGATA